MMHLDLGSKVKSSDDHEIGRVDRIIFEPDSRKVREFVVHKGFFLGDDRIISRSHVDHIDDDHTVYLDLNADEINDLPPFLTEQHVPVFSGGFDVYSRPSDPTFLVQQGSAPRDAVVLTHSSDVYDCEGKDIGHIDEVVFADDGVVTDFVIDAGHLITHDVRIPVSRISMVTRDRIELNVTREEAERESAVVR